MTSSAFLASWRSFSSSGNARVSDNPDMRDDAVIANAGRLKILAALSTESRLEFVRLRDRAKLTDGNLASHAKRLHEAGLVEIQKRFDSGKPVTTYVITPRGRDALQEHIEKLMGAISRVADREPSFESAQDESQPAVASHEDDWVD